MRVHISSRREERARRVGRVRGLLLRILYVLGGIPLNLRQRAVKTRPAKAARSAVARMVPSVLIHDKQMRAAAISMVVGIVHVAYAGVNVVIGLITRSMWTFSVGAFMALLNAGKSYVASGAITGGALKGEKGESTLSLKRCRNAGIGLTLLNLAMSGTVIQLVIHGPGYATPGALVYAYAAYALVQITVAIVNQVRVRHDERLVMTGVRMFNLAGALMSLFALLAAVLSRISWDSLPAQVTRKAVETLAGSLVCLIMVAMGILLARAAVARLRKRQAGMRVKRPGRGKKKR